jgi:Ca2+-binding EF-hand superfamily protein
MRRVIVVLALLTVFGVVAFGSYYASAEKAAESCEERFKKYDHNGDGKISKVEYEETYGKGGTSEDASADKGWAEQFKELDTNGDGELSQEEFCA